LRKPVPSGWDNCRSGTRRAHSMEAGCPSEWPTERWHRKLYQKRVISRATEHAFQRHCESYLYSRQTKDTLSRKT
jgi:hypothetical protein